MMVLVKLFLVFLKVGLFAFGGAYSFLPLLEKELVENHQWLARDEFMEIVGITKVFPGAISIKFASYTGYKIGGIPGMILANLANVISPILFIVCASFLYKKYNNMELVRVALKAVQFAVFAMIIAVAIRLVDRSHILQFKNLVIVTAAFLFFVLTKVHPAFIIIGAAAFGIISHLLEQFLV